MEKSIYQYNDIKEVKKAIFNFQDKNLEKKLSFLDNFLTKKISNDIIFNYCNEISLNRSNKKVSLGNILKINQDKRTITIYKHKEYIPYYDETNIIEKYNFEERNLINFIDLLIIKFINYTHSERKKLDGLYNFPKYAIMNSIDTQNKKKICKQLKIEKNYYTYTKYEELLEKYKILLLDFYKAIVSNN